MGNESRLSITIDSRSAEQRADDLKNALKLLTNAGVRLTQNNEKVTDSSKQAGAAMAEAGTNAKRGAAGVDSINKSIKNTDSTAAKASATVRRTLIDAFAGISAMNIIDMADQWSQYDNRIQRATKSTEEYSYVNQRLQQSAKDTFRPIDETKESFINLSPVLRDMGLTLSQSIDAVDAFSGLLVVNGANAERGAAAFQALSTSMQKGKVDADAWSTIYSTTDSIVDSLAKSTGKSADEIRKLGAEGKLTGAQLAKALAEDYPSIVEQVRGMPTAVRGAFNNMNTTLSEYIGQQNKAYGITAKMAGGINYLTDNLDMVAKAAGVVGVLVASRITGPIISSGVAFTGSTIQSIRYQTALAAMTGVGQKTAATLGVLTVATSGASAAMAFIGGPAGLLITAASAMAYFALKTDSTTESLDQMQEPLSKIREKFAKLNFDQRQAQLVKWSDAAATATKNVSDAYSDLKTEISADETYLGAFMVEPEYATRLKAELDKAKESGEDLVPIIQRIGQENGIPQENIDRWIKLAGAVSDADDKLTNANLVLADLNDTSAIVSRELDDLIAGPLFGMTKESINLKDANDSLGKSSQNLLQSLRDEYAQVSLSTEELKKYNIEKAKKEITLSTLTDPEKLEAASLVEKTQRSKEAKKATEDHQSAVESILTPLQQQVSLFNASAAEQFKLKLATSLLTDAEKIRAQTLYDQHEALQKSATAQSNYASLMESLRTENQKTNDTFKSQIAILDAAELSADEYANAMLKISQGTISQAPSFGGDAAVGGAAGEMTKVNEAQTALEQWRTNELARQQEFLAQKLINEQQYADRVTEITATYNQKLTDIEQQRQIVSAQLTQSLLTSTGDMFSAMADMSSNFAGKQSGIYKTLFITSKTFSIAAASLNMWKALSDAMATGTTVPQKIANYAIVATQMGTIISSLSSISMAGFKTGGYTGNLGVNDVAGLVHGKEFVFDSQATSRIGVNNLEALRSGRNTTSDIISQASNTASKSNSTGNNVSFNVVVNAETGNTDVSGDQNSQYKQLGVMIGNAVRKIIIDEQRPMGLLDSRKR